MSSSPNNPLPPRPQPPVDYDCCGGGCADCELRLYAQRLAQWLQLEATVDKDANKV